MFKLESYITPLLMGYLDKYVQLRQEDFQLSLWGGDAVLNNLDLRLNELEKVIQLPVMFQSGHIHELRLHVPWTKLGSEPVVITINTVECIVKVRDTAYESTQTNNASNSPKRIAQQRVKNKKRLPPTEELPPGYLQSIVNRIINNVTFIINNLILKFVEDDIVLSVNIKSAECYSVDKEWNRAFADLTPDNLALRKVLNFADLTVCLDKTNASGHIESYQEPVAYRCAMTCRLYMEYESHLAKFPRVTRFNLYCDTLNLSLTDTQLPMLVRLIELCIAMYYGTLDIPTSAPVTQAADETPQFSTDVDTGTELDTDVEVDQSLDQGWVSWAWSYVPQILPSEEEETDVEKQLMEEGRRGKPTAHILSLGFYFHHGVILFKLTEKSKEGSELPHKKIHFHPFLKLSGEGLGIEVLLQGLTFCDIQCGFTSFKLSTCGSCICGVPDEKVERCNILLSGGEQLDTKAGLTYITHSLFDDTSWENMGRRSQHIVDAEQHRQVFTEQHALQRFGAFWVDSLYTFEKPEKYGASSNSSETDSSEPTFQKEFSTLRFVLGNTHLNVSSTLYHRLGKLIACAQNRQYQPYGNTTAGSSIPGEDRPKPSEDQVQSLEEFIPTVLLHVMIINPTVMILSAEHPHCDVAKKSYRVQHKKRDSKTVEEPHHPSPLPALVLSVSRFDLQITKPMYPQRLVRLVTAIAGPSSNLLHHCHSHMQIKLFSFQVGIQRVAWDRKTSRVLTLVPPCSFALYSRSMVLPKLWTNSSLPQQEWMYEIPSVSLNVNKASVILCCRLLSSWLAVSKKQEAEFILNDSLLDDLFPVSGESSHQDYPLLEIGMYGLEFKSCESSLVNACVASLSSFNVFLYTPGVGGKMSAIPILYGPSDTSNVNCSDFFTGSTLIKSEVRSDFITATFQKPKQTRVSEAQALALVDCQGACVWLDPGLISWFHYCPQPRPARKQDPPVSLDLSLAHMTSPLNIMSNASLHSASSPSHPGHQTASLTKPQLLDRPTSIPEETSDPTHKNHSGVAEDSFGKLLASYFPLIRMLHVQVELKPAAIFLPKTSIPNSESSSDILALVHQARLAGRLSDTLVVCVPSIVVMSSMAKPMSVVQELPVTSIQGSLIGDKLPWTVKVNNLCAYSLQSGRHDAVFLLHPLDILATIAVNCKYNPPTSENISTLALCLHVDVASPQLEMSANQLQLCSTMAAMFSNLVSNANKLAEDCGKLFFLAAEDKTLMAAPAPTSLKISASSTCKIESIRSAEVTENTTADISEDFSREASPLHESLIEDSEEAGVKLSLWLQLLIPKLTVTMYATCPVTDQENSLALNLEHFDLTVDSQNVYSKVKMTLGLVKILHSIKQKSGSWCLSPAEGVVVSFMKQLPHKMVVVTNKMWGSSQGTPVFHQDAEETPNKDKKSVVSITFTRALCRNVKRRLRKANVELPSIGDPEFSTAVEGNDLIGGQQFDPVDIYFYEYLSEVCVKTETLDIVLKPELVALVNSVISGVSKSSKAGKNTATDLKSDFTKFQHSRDQGSVGVVNLPLLYADIGTIRIFVPQTQTLLAGSNHEVPEETGLIKNTPLIQPEGLRSTARSSVQSTAVSTDTGSISQHAAAITTQPAHHASSVGFQTPGTDVLPDMSSTVTSTMTTQNVGQSFTDSPKSVSLESKLGKEGCSAIYHDMAILQVSGCMLQPHAENPLPRNAQEKEVFNYAVQSGFTQQPGAVLEDRQYQFDIKGVSLATGVWDHILKEMKLDSHRKAPQGSQVQIPALDWNTYLMDSSTQEVKEIRLIPIVAPFDLSIVVAPPITYQPKDSSYMDSLHTRLICGFSSELNLTSDLDLYINPTQIKLLTDIVCQISEYSSTEPHKTGLHILPASPLPAATHNGKWRSQQPSDFMTGADSGVESDLSTLTLDLGHRQVPYRQMLQVTTAPSNLRKRPEKTDEGRLPDTSGGGPSDLLFPFTNPVDILVTAGRISCTVYSYKVLEENLVLELLNFRDRLPAHERSGTGTSSGDTDRSMDHNGDGTTARDNLEHLLNHSRQSQVGGTNSVEELDDCQVSYLIPEDVQVLDEGLKKVIPRGSVCLVPFLYVYVAQPHCLMSSHLRESTKMEVSCYDVMVKAAADQHVIAADDHHLLPESADFNSHWLETKAGCPHPFTGIPPSLLTARFLRESSKPDTLSIKVERPVRLKLSQLVVEQAITFCSELKVVFPRHSLESASDPSVLEHKMSDNKNIEISSLVDRVDITTSQIVVDLSFTDSHMSPGIVLSVETATFQADKEPNFSIVPYLHIEDIMIKTSYEKQLQQFIGPFSVKTDGLISWISLPNNLFLPQVLLDVEVGYLPVTFGQEHMFCLNELSQKMSTMMQKLTEDASGSQTSQVSVTDKNISGQISSCAFILDGSHDDLRSGGFQFIEKTDGSSFHPDVGQIYFQEVNPQSGENSSMSWHYPTPRVITHINLTPVPFNLSTALSSGAVMVQCVLQYWDELRGSFEDLVEFHLSENETVSVSMPEPKASNTSRLVAASIWRVLLVQPTQNSEIGAAVLPPSLAACMCVDSACIPSLIPSVQLSVVVSAAEIRLCHHLKYNGSDLPVRLRQYQICPEQCQEQIFAVVRVDDLTSAMTHVAGTESKTCVKLSLETSLDVLEYGHLKMEPVLSALKIQGYVDTTCSQKTEITGNIQVDELRLRVGKGCVHTLNTAATAWSTFNTRGVGPCLMFSYYIVCNNTTSTVRFGQAGTDENLILNSMEMFAYRWRTCNASQMLHLCLNEPSWRWTEPFLIDKEGSTIRSVSARDQNYLVIIKVKQIANLLLQVTISGQLVISNRLSQPISMKTSLSSLSNGKDKKDAGHQYIIQPGTILPSVVSSDVLLYPVQFRLAGCTTSWSHDIFLSGDRMKDSQLVKIPLPDSTSYFHIWCRVFCQHFQGLPQKMGVSKTATVKLVMLTPLYVVRTHLPHPLYIHLDSPKAKKSQEIKARSQGQEFQLHCTGGDVTHQLSFRLCSGMMLSSPAVVLSTGLIDQLPRTPVGSVDIEQICEQKMDLVQQQWPYLSDDAIITQEMESGITAASQVLVSEQINGGLSGNSEQEETKQNKETQPSITLNIRLTEYLAGCDTLLVEVTPPYLVHNATDLEVNVSGAEGTSWCIHPSETMAPPLLKNEFKLAIKYNNVTSQWKSIPVSEESVDYRRYNEDIGTVLFIDGYVHISFLFHLSEGDRLVGSKSEVSRSEVVFLTITSGDQNGIRVICIRERFAVTNNTGKNLTLKLLTLPLSLQQVKMAELEGALVGSLLDQSHIGFREGQQPTPGVPLALFRWSTVSSSCFPEDQDNIPETNNSVYVSYISFAASSDLPTHLKSPSSKWRWSLPVRVVSSRDGYRTTTSIPDFVVTQRDTGEEVGPAEWTPVSHAVCVVTQMHQGITHIVLNNDEAPACIVENLCSFSLEFGQTCDTLTSTDAVVQEQVELVSDVPWVPPGGWCHYTPPSVNSEFITKETINIPRLHFRAADISLEESSSGSSAWSSGVQITGNLDAFVRLPNFCDLKILIQSVGMVTHLIVRPVSKAEITAKEIRSRIMNSGEVRIITSDIEHKSDKTKFGPGVAPSADTKVTSASSEVSASVSRDSSVAASACVKLLKGMKQAPIYTQFSEKQRLKKNQNTVSLTLGVLCSSCIVSLLDESNGETVSDLMSIHFRDLFFTRYPVFRGPDHLDLENSFAFSVGEVQIDNQQYGVGAFDFPVVLLPQKTNKTGTLLLPSLNSSSLSVLELHAILKSKAFIHLQVVTVCDKIWQQFVIETLDVTIKPLSLYIDDTFIYRLVEELESFNPSRLSTSVDMATQCYGVLNRKLPTVVKLNSYTLSHPIRIKHVVVHPLKMLLSVHASLKLFLASDHTPLSMSKFERVNVYSTLQRMTHAFTVHYASAAVFRAGIVVGSLEILGNPTGLVRSIGTGVSDLISLPYSGLSRGPGAFVTGLSRGFGSLVKNVSAGMITSVTNFASSVSRNMDRLSLDSSHLERQEENRRNRPLGVSDGLKQGLTGFGISLLGAVAGLADQPIQTLLASGNQDKPRSSASSRASGLMTGVGKGLVGVITKPIGGVAEFVSQTGQGILHGAGLAHHLVRLEKPYLRSKQDLPNSQYKHAVKIFSSLPNHDLLLMVPAVTYDHTGSEVRVELLLTSDVLVVMNVEEDAQQQTFTLAELECLEDGEDGKLLLQWMDRFYGTSSQDLEQSSNKERVAAFIDTQTPPGQGMELSSLPDRPRSSLVEHLETQVPDALPRETGLEDISVVENSSNQRKLPPSMPQYEFQMKPHLKLFFLAVFKIGKQKQQGRGFPVC